MVDFVTKLDRASPNKLHLQTQPLKKDFPLHRPSSMLIYAE